MFRFLSLLTLFLSSFYVVAQNNVFTSKVVDCKTKVVLKSCIIEVIETKETLLSDERGEFTCKNLTNGIYTIIISKEGYEEKTLSIAINDSSEINQTIELCKTDFQSIDNVVVTA
ncbi:MAG: carboxypeptidase-like regulatory domain-containing protein, partial [Crocinitomicaceae bacterium]